MSNKGDEVNTDFKSKFLTDAEVVKEHIGSSLCLAKWKQVSLHLTTGLNNSCYHPPLHRISVDDIRKDPGALHNTKHKKEQRRIMLNGSQPRECNYCWMMEKQGKLSDRHYRSGEPWAFKDLEKIKNSNGDEDILPSYVEVNFNHACNLTCSYCSPQFSSSWMEEAKQYGAYPTSTPHNDPNYFVAERRPIPNREYNPYVNAFWGWWPTLYPELEHFRMTGGEPLLDKNTYRVFDYVLDNPSKKLHLNVTSNFSVDEKSWQKYKDYVKRLCDGEKIEHFMQYVSVDTWGAQAEYIRHGLDFNLLWDRVNQYLEEIPYRNSLTFIITMNNLSVPNLDKLLAGILGLRKTYSKTYQRVWFDTPVLRTPSWQSLQILPEAYADHLEDLWHWMKANQEVESDRFHGFKDYECNRLDRDIAWMRDGKNLDQQYLQQQQANFYNFFNEYDRRHNTSFIEVFPELLSWWNQCKFLAR